MTCQGWITFFVLFTEQDSCILTVIMTICDYQIFSGPRPVAGVYLCAQSLPGGGAGGLWLLQRRILGGAKPVKRGAKCMKWNKNVNNSVKVFSGAPSR